MVEDQNKVLNAAVQHLLNFTPTAGLVVGGQIIDIVTIQLYDQILPISAMPKLVLLDFEDNELTRKCQSEQDVQKKFAAFFKNLPPGISKWVIHDTSLSGYFHDPTTKIDFSIMDSHSLVALPLRRGSATRLGQPDSFMAISRLTD